MLKNQNTSKIQTINRRLLIAGFIVANLLWVKALFDLNGVQDVRPNFRFPAFFLPLFLFGAITALCLSAYCLKDIWKSNQNIKPKSGRSTLLLWLAIPISVLCTMPVCYVGTIFISPFLINTIIRWGLLIIPIIACLLYFKDKKEIGILILLCLSFLLLTSSCKCYNPFNYWWVDNVGASPLEFLPTMFVMLFAITGFYGMNKYLITAIVYVLSAGALFIAIGHQTKLLW